VGIGKLSSRARIGPVAALLVLAASISLGPREGSRLAPRTGPPAFDVAGVVELVAHRVTPGRGGLLVSEDRRDRAEFGPSGFSLRPPGARGAVAVETSRIDNVAVAPGEWRADRNTATRSLTRDVDERVVARDGRVEWDFVLARPLAARG